MKKGNEVHRPDSLQVSVEANQIADNFCSLGCTIENDYFKDQETPRNILCPPHFLEFYYEHGGRTFDGDTSTDVAKLCDIEMRNRSANYLKHGAAIRHLTKWSFNPTSLGRNSVKNAICDNKCSHQKDTEKQNATNGGLGD